VVSGPLASTSVRMMDQVMPVVAVAYSVSLYVFCLFIVTSVYVWHITMPCLIPQSLSTRSMSACEGRRDVFYLLLSYRAAIHTVTPSYLYPARLITTDFYSVADHIAMEPSCPSSLHSKDSDLVCFPLGRYLSRFPAMATVYGFPRKSWASLRERKTAYILLTDCQVKQLVSVSLLKTIAES
jgi:hypothetical protein